MTPAPSTIEKTGDATEQRPGTLVAEKTSHRLSGDPLNDFATQVGERRNVR
jgi:hypothetical protein